MTHQEIITGLFADLEEQLSNEMELYDTPSQDLTESVSKWASELHEQELLDTESFGWAMRIVGQAYDRIANS
jgi:hypothetical protein